jgi:hypothetical protein
VTPPAARLVLLVDADGDPGGEGRQLRDDALRAVVSVEPPQVGGEPRQQRAAILCRRDLVRPRMRDAIPFGIAGAGYGLWTQHNDRQAQSNEPSSVHVVDLLHGA